MPQKPYTCNGCTLFSRGHSFANAIGPSNAKILLVGEALGRDEALRGEPFVGQAGSMLNKILRLGGFNRDQFRIHNLINCQPPNNWLDGAPWEAEAVEHCSQYLNATLAEGHSVVVPLGALPTRRLLGLPPGVGKMENFHGTVNRDPTDRFWVVPSFHPSYIARGAYNLIGVCIFDIQTAVEVATKGRPPENGKLVQDPDPRWFSQWVQIALAWARRQPKPPWLAADIETPEKASGAAEDDLKSGKSLISIAKAHQMYPQGTAAGAVKARNKLDPTNTILRINFAYKEDEGITVPFDGRYIDGIRKLLSSPLFSKVFWNMPYDRPRLEVNECPVAEPAHDFMWAWHVLQSDVPKGLGFVAPFFSKWGAWKHLSGPQPARYAAIDGIQTIRCAYGIEKDLTSLGMWDAYYRHVYLLDTLALKPAEEVGLLFDKGSAKDGTGLRGFTKMLSDRKAELVEEIGQHIPDELLPRKPYKTKNKSLLDAEGNLLPGVEEVEDEILTGKCGNCGKIDVSKSHANTKGCMGATIELVEERVKRWNKLLPFNPSSPQQILAYIKYRGHKPGRHKKDRDKETTELQVIKDLYKKHKDPVYKCKIELSRVDKLKGTYGDGMLKRMDVNDRVHTTFSHTPSTQRLSSVDPNLQNLVKRGDQESPYAKMFRSCVLAAPGCKLIEADYCVGPNERILKADLTWTRAADIKAGDALIAFDEKLDRNTSFKASTVKRVKKITRPRVRVITDRGTTIVASKHPFSARRHKGKKEWIEAKNLKPGMLLNFCKEPWETEISKDGGYLAGFFDGEGWVSGHRLGYGQNKGLILDKVNNLLTARDIAFTNSNNSSSVEAYEATDMWTALKFLGTIRPDRLLPKSYGIWENRRIWGKRTKPATVLAVEPMSSGTVIAIETTTKTYISEGFFSHNSGIEAVQVGWFSGDKDYIRLATAGVHSYLCSHIFKEPADLSWDDKTLAEYLGRYKHSPDAEVQEMYARAKRVIHGCFTGEHEVLTRNGWVRLEDYNWKDSIAEWDPSDASISFKTPVAKYVRRHVGDMVSLEGRSMSAFVTPNHGFPVRTSQGYIKRYEAFELPKANSIPLVGKLKGGDDSLDQRAIRLYVAIQADGTIRPGGQVTFRLKKQRKIERLDFLLLGREFSKSEPDDRGVIRYYIPRESIEDVTTLFVGYKLFDLEQLIKLSVEGRETFLDELPYWDGTRSKGSGSQTTYMSTIRHNADVVQAVAHITGRQALLREKKPSSGAFRNKLMWMLSFNQRTEASLECLERKEISNFDGTIYCPKTSTGYFLVRGNGKVFVSANTNYGMTPMGMHLNYPETFKKVKDAKLLYELYMDVCPKLHEWQKGLIQRAHRQGYLGGSDHPFRYRHWFWNVINYRSIDKVTYERRIKKKEQAIENDAGYWAVYYGDDAKRAIAFYPQSTAGGIIKETCLALFDPEQDSTYIGDVFYGKTPFRMPIHDSIVLEVPDNKVDYTLERLVEVMSRPVKQQPCPPEWGIGQEDGLKIGIEVEIGQNWGKMERVNV